MSSAESSTPAADAEVPDRVIATDAAVQLLTKLSELHGGLMIHQSGGCCDGSAPMCYPVGEYRVGQRDVDRRKAPGGGGQQRRSLADEAPRRAYSMGEHVHTDDERPVPLDQFGWWRSLLVRGRPSRS